MGLKIFMESEALIIRQERTIGHHFIKNGFYKMQEVLKTSPDLDKHNLDVRKNLCNEVSMILTNADKLNASRLEHLDV